MPDGSTRRVLEDIDVAVHAEEVVALLGPSGCGKSTILRILAGLLPPTKGEVKYHDKTMAGLNPGVAIVFQSFALFPWMTVTENLEVVLEAAGLSRDEIRERAAAAIKLVGLAGFEEAYPRELSGGMKQRVGISRALSMKPEMLFMDEPFSQVDALTAESLRSEVLDIWGDGRTNPSSILMVSHDIKEVAYMADRIVILSANPGKVRTIVDNPLPRPRDYRSKDMLKLVDKLHDIITGHEMPDEVEAKVQPAVRDVTTFEVLPDAPSTEIVGLLEYLGGRGGKQDLFEMAAHIHQDFGRVMSTVKAAELLDFVDTPRRLVVLLDEGVRFVDASAADRKGIWREQLLKLRLFRKVNQMMAIRKRITKDTLLRAIRIWMPNESADRVFETFIGWARFGDLFAYDVEAGVLTPQ
jgi:NitT/TauT family transport system ATP-binding protein